MHSPDTRVQIFYQYLKISSGKCIFVTQLTLLVEAPCCKDCEEETPFHVETVAQRLKCPFIVVTKAAADSRVSVRSSDVFSPDCRQFQQFLPYFAQFQPFLPDLKPLQKKFASHASPRLFELNSQTARKVDRESRR